MIPLGYIAHDWVSRSSNSVSPVAYVVVVDDDEDTLEAIRDVLTSEGYAVECAHDGEHALSLLEIKHPDLLILDLMMPRMNGWELLSHLHHNPPPAPMSILVLTADRGGFDVQAIEGVSACLGKPVDLDGLLLAVASLTAGIAPSRVTP